MSTVPNAIEKVATAITPNVAPGTDSEGAHVESLTEAVMGVEVALSRIADGIADVAVAMRDANELSMRGPS